MDSEDWRQWSRSGLAEPAAVTGLAAAPRRACVTSRKGALYTVNDDEVLKAEGILQPFIHHTSVSTSAYHNS